MSYLIVRVFRGRNNGLLNHMKKMFIEVKIIQNKNQFTGSQIA